MEQAREPEQYHQLSDMLRLWRLRASAYSSPGYEDRLQEARGSGSTDFVPAEQVFPDWPPR